MNEQDEWVETQEVYIRAAQCSASADYRVCPAVTSQGAAKTQPWSQWLQGVLLVRHCLLLLDIGFVIVNDQHVQSITEDTYYLCTKQFPRPLHKQYSENRNKTHRIQNKYLVANNVGLKTYYDVDENKPGACCHLQEPDCTARGQESQEHWCWIRSRAARPAQGVHTGSVSEGQAWDQRPPSS